MESLVSFKNLCIGVKRGDEQSIIVNDLSLDIYPGEIIGLVGESGSGKSISALSILQLLPMPPMFYPSGELQFEGVDVTKASAAKLREIRGNKVGCIFQEPMTSLNPLQTIEKQMAEVMFLHRGWSIKQSTNHILEWLARVELREPEKKLQAYPHQLSGGERQRVMIAMALLNEPALLIADEPTTALDVTVQAQILELIKRLQKQLNMAVLFISHDLGVVRAMADRVAVMQKGQLVEVKATQALFETPEHSYTQKLFASEPKGDPVPVDHDDILLTTEQVKIWFPIQRGVFRKTVDHIKAVSDVSIALKRGHTLGIVGESGSGKSTLAKAILGLQSSEGDIRYQQTLISALTRKQWQPFRQKIQVVFQDPYGSLSPRMSIQQIIAEGLEVNNIGDKFSQEQAVIEMMLKVGLDPQMRHRYPNEFSGGQRQRIAIARAMILAPELVILDEPTSSLDRTVQFQIIELLKSLQQEKQMSYIFISHDLKVVKSIAHDVVVMQNGFVVEQGPQVFSQPLEDYTKKLVETAFRY